MPWFQKNVTQTTRAIITCLSVMTSISTQVWRRLMRTESNLGFVLEICEQEKSLSMAWLLRQKNQPVSRRCCSGEIYKAIFPILTSTSMTSLSASWAQGQCWLGREYALVDAVRRYQNVIVIYYSGRDAQQVCQWNDLEWQCSDRKHQGSSSKSAVIRRHCLLL